MMLQGLALLVALAAAPVTGPAEIRRLTLEEALALTAQHQPGLAAASAAAAAAGYRADAAVSNYLPQLSATARYQRSGTALFTNENAPGDAVTQVLTPNAFDQYNGSLTVNQLLYDFGRTPQRIAGAKASERASKADARNAGVLSAYETRTAFFQAQARMALRESAAKSLANQRRHAAFISAQVEVGLRPSIDRLQAGADLANAELQLIQAANEYDTAKERLKAAMGAAGFGPFDVTGPALAPVEGEEAPAERLLDQALAARPDMQSLEAERAGGRYQLSAVRRSYFPTLVGSGALTTGGPQLDDLHSGWSLGVALNWSIFEGGLTRAQAGEATENLKVTDARVARLRLDIAAELQQALLAIRAAKAAEVAAREAASNAQQRLRLAEERYRTGLGSMIELSDAQLRATSAEAQEIEAAYNLSQARSALLKSLGRP